MAYKNSDPTLEKIADDEPFFVLRAQDMTAPTVVRIWAEIAALSGSPSKKILEARMLACRMNDWAEMKGHEVKVPD